MDYILSPIVSCVSYRTEFLGMLVLYVFTQKPAFDGLDHFSSSLADIQRSPYRQLLAIFNIVN
jgi:hypothetical protein